uniref:Zeta toxin domain-containing protein n=1 Tax=Arcella intermedia TaxID=1963864 RepID=A0A6B2L7C5_9EUKA
MDGNIYPIFTTDPDSDRQELKELTKSVGPLPFDSAQLNLLLADFRTKALSMNQQYRTEENRVEGYYYSNFLIEGKVLYCLDQNNMLTHREAIYKIKPSDIETSHRVVFDYAMQYRSLEALSKLYSRGDKCNEENMRKELDLSPSAWSLFGQEIMALTQGVPNLYSNLPISNQKILIMVGVPGSGKSTIANQLVSLDNRWFRVNQDEMKSRPACEKYARDALKKGYSLIVDRCNFDIKQRSTWIKMAAEFNINDIRCLNFMIPFEVCKARISVREDHPTIPSGDSGHAIIDSFVNILVPPIRLEGLTDILVIKDDADIARALQTLSTLHAPPEHI